MKLVYLASPYSNKAPWVRWWRWRKICKVQAALSRHNPKHCFYGPISMNHPLASKYGLPTDFFYWKETCETVLDRCDELWVVTLNGWDDSVGVNNEIKYAAKLNIPIRYIDVDSE